MKFDKQFIKKIDAVLPQTQCRQCGFSGCEPYATAIVEGRADINQCPPGGVPVINKIATLLGIAVKSPDPSYGKLKPRAVAVINEHQCIGCTFCIRACPVDAIAGAAKQMHTVIADECTGCELCLAPCPMDCIHMVAVSDQTIYADTTSPAYKNIADRARLRYQFKQQRLAQNAAKMQKKNAKSTVEQSENLKNDNNETRKKTAVQAALQRAAVLRSQTRQQKIKL